MLLEYLRSADPTINLSTGKWADKTIYYEVDIVEIHKAS
jgi:hypothetical protein